MKVSLFLVIATFCATAASAFGLNGASSIAKAVSPKSFAAKKPMVQAVDVQGNRLNSLVSDALLFTTIITPVCFCWPST